jgi:hypothetical protein
MPKGGVTMPTQRLITIKTPKYTTSIPRLLTIGIRIGANKRRAGVTSRKHPRKSKKANIRRRATVGL